MITLADIKKHAREAYAAGLLLAQAPDEVFCDGAIGEVVAILPYNQYEVLLENGETVVVGIEEIE